MKNSANSSKKRETENQTPASEKTKPDAPSGSGMLTEQEIKSLQEDKKRTLQQLKGRFKHLR